ncbi:MAG: hypothetical protein PHG97_04235 [Candidatus Margulisbacteria bacterium]|nr:hypothetical protein [Candidatus Margulisiibacteriota bacterium]
MPIYLWVLELFLLLLLIHSINAVINPEKIVQWTIERYRGILKFYCFECEIKPSARSVSVIRIGHLIVAILLVVYMVLIVLFGRYY